MNQERFFYTSSGKYDILIVTAQPDLAVSGSEIPDSLKKQREGGML